MKTIKINFDSQKMNYLESLITLQFIFYLPRYFQNENINTQDEKSKGDL